MSEKKFPILGTNESIDWNLIAPHEKQAMENHGQTLEKLARRHGLSWYELLCVMADKKLLVDIEYDKEKDYEKLCRQVLLLEEVKQYRAIGTVEECRAAEKKQKSECEWKLEDSESNLYVTGCENRQLIFEGTPEENGYKYCPYCGRKIKRGGIDG
mgnify:CR=1 FL=1